MGCPARSPPNPSVAPDSPPPLGHMGLCASAPPRPTHTVVHVAPKTGNVDIALRYAIGGQPAAASPDRRGVVHTEAAGEDVVVYAEVRVCSGCACGGPWRAAVGGLRVLKGALASKLAFRA